VWLRGQSDMCFRVWKYSSTYIVRNQKQWCWRWILVFLKGVYQSSGVSSRIRVKTSFLDDNQELHTQGKGECFSALMSVSAEKTRSNQVVLFSPPYTSSHLSPQVCTFMYPPPGTCPVALLTLWNHGENLSESFVKYLFVKLISKGIFSNSLL
jgi:hypothetical protein